jgi:spoIIIJ-associated protein
MESIEQTGRTVEEAVGAALKTLGVSREDVDVEVLAEESRGLLGILGYSAARVRVTLKRDQRQPEPPPPAPTEEEPPEPELEPLASVEPGERSALAEEALDILNQIMGRMGLEATAEITGDDAESVSIDIHSAEEIGLLIGKHGQTLAALQLIVAMMANRGQPPESRRRVILDAEGYRARRDRTLEAMARSAAQRAKRSGRPVTLSALTPRERRIIHVTLADDPTVTTRSEGEDPDRAIVVMARQRTRE